MVDDFQIRLREVGPGSDSEAGSWFAEQLFTMVVSCHQYGRPVLDLLVAAGEVPLQDTVAPSLLPGRTQEG